MEAELKGENSLANGSTNSAKRGRGRPKGSVKKTIISMTELTHNARTTKRVDFFSPEVGVKAKVKRRGRPKKIRIPGRPRKIPLTPEEEAERILRFCRQKKRKISKPLGRPRIHPVVGAPSTKRGRGRPRKYESLSRASSQNITSLKRHSEGGEAAPRKRGRPRGSFKKNLGSPISLSLAKRAIGEAPRGRGRPPGSGRKITTTQASNGTPRKRGRPPGSGNKLKIMTQVAGGGPRKRGRPPGSGLKIKLATRINDGIPRKRGRPPGSGNKPKVPPQDVNSVPRKRGRPPGSGKAKTLTKTTTASDTTSSSNGFSPSGPPRKRGRPSKASLTQTFLASNAEGDAEMNDASFPKQPQNAFTSSEGDETVTVVHAEDPNGSENDVVISGDELKNPVEEVQEVLITGSEGNIRRGASPRGAGKSQKKK